MQPSTPSNLLMALADFQSAAADFLQVAARRLAAEDGLSADTIRQLETHLTKMVLKGTSLDRVICRLPNPSWVSPSMRDDIRAELDRNQRLLDVLKVAKTFAVPRRYSEQRPASGCRKNKRGRGRGTRRREGGLP